MKLTTIRLLVAVALSQAIGSTAQATPLYNVTYLGTLGGIYSDAYGINNNGQVVGEASLSSTSETYHAALWSGGSITDIAPNGGTQSTAYAINDSGEIVGTAAAPPNYPGYFPYPYNAAVWSGGTMAVLQTGIGLGYAYGVNDAGQVIGQAGGGGWFIDNNGTLTSFGPEFSSAQAINNSGQVVGQMNAGNGVHAFSWKNGTMTDIGTLGGNIGGAQAVNNTGQIVGYSNFGDNTTDYATLWNNGIAQSLGTLYGSSDAVDIDDAGEVVGSSDLQSGAQHAVTWIDDQIFDLNALLASPSAGVTLTSANGINDEGWIVGQATFANGSAQAVLLTPIVPEPATWLLATIGVGGMWFARRPRTRGTITRR